MIVVGFYQIVYRVADRLIMLFGRENAVELRRESFACQILSRFRIKVFRIGLNVDHPFVERDPPVVESVELGNAEMIEHGQIIGDIIFTVRRAEKPPQALIGYFIR